MKPRIYMRNNFVATYREKFRKRLNTQISVNVINDSLRDEDGMEEIEAVLGLKYSEISLSFWTGSLNLFIHLNAMGCANFVASLMSFSIDYPFETQQPVLDLIDNYTCRSSIELDKCFYEFSIQEISLLMYSISENPAVGKIAKRNFIRKLCNVVIELSENSSFEGDRH